MSAHARRNVKSAYECRLKPINIYERQQMYQLHRMRVQNMKSKVNSQAPPRNDRVKPQQELSLFEMMTSIRNAVQCADETLTFTRSPVGAHNKVHKLHGYPKSKCYKVWQQQYQQPSLIYRYDYDTHSQSEERDERRKISTYNIVNGISDPLLVRCGNQQQKFPPDGYHRSIGGTTQCQNRCKWLQNRVLPTAPQILTPPQRIRERVAGGFGGEDARKHPVQYYNWNGIPVRTGYMRQQQQQQQCETTDASYSITQLPNAKKESDEAKRNGIPPQVLQRYQHLTGSRNIPLLRKLLRPKIYLDLEVKHLRPLGRLVIQLFTEACPEVVLELVRICTMQTRERFHFTRLFPPMWMEGELALTDNKTLTGRSIEHDTTVLDHGCGAGILSFPSRYVRGSKRPFLSFSISFKPLKVLNGKRIAFGKVRRGNWILDAIQDYGTNSGKPLKEIIVTRCGLLQ